MHTMRPVLHIRCSAHTSFRGPGVLAAARSQNLPGGAADASPPGVHNAHQTRQRSLRMLYLQQQARVLQELPQGRAAQPAESFKMRVEK